VFGAIFASRLDLWLPRELHGGAHGVDAEGLQAAPATLRAMPAAIRHGVAHAVANSLETVFLVAAPVALLALVVVLKLREVPLKGRPEPKRERRRADPRAATA
jgi:hypothetical protein